MVVIRLGEGLVVGPVLASTHTRTTMPMGHTNGRTGMCKKEKKRNGGIPTRLMMFFSRNPACLLSVVGDMLRGGAVRDYILPGLEARRAFISTSTWPFSMTTAARA